MSYPAAFFALLFSSAALAAAVFPDLSDGSGASARRLGLLKMRFEGLLREARCPYGVVCVAQGGRAVMAEAVGIPGVENGAELKRRAEGDPKSLALVFCRTKHGANKLAKKLNSRGIGAAAIHGNKSQSARRRALEDFKERKIGALVATDIAARGIDVKDMSLVVNFDLPEEPETYVHRIGRTARAEASGMAVSFCTPDDGDLLAQILRYIKRDIPEFTENPYRVEPPKFARPGDSRRGGARRGGASRRGAGGGVSKGRASGKSGARNPRPPKRSGGERGGSRAGAPRNSDSRNSGLGGPEKKSASKPSKLGGIFGLMGFGRKGR